MLHGFCPSNSCNFTHRDGSTDWNRMVALKQSNCWTDLLPELLSSKFLYVVEIIIVMAVIGVVEFWTEKMLFQ